MYKNSIKFTILTMIFALILAFASISPVNAYSVDNNTEMVNDTIIQESAVGGFNRYYADRPYQENTLDIVQFTQDRLFLAAAATPTSNGHADYVIIRIKQRDWLNIMQTRYSGTVYTDGISKLIVDAKSITPNKDVEITAEVRSYNGTICTANISISASTD